MRRAARAAVPALFLAFVAAAAALQPVRAQSAGEPPGAGDNFLGQWMMIHAGIDAGGQTVSVSGSTNLPDGLQIDLLVERRGSPADSVGSARVSRGGFSGIITLPRALQAGYYVVRANCDPQRNIPRPGDPPGILNPISTVCPLVLGDPEEIRKSSETNLKFYEELIQEVESTFSGMEETYEELLKTYDPVAAPDSWRAKYDPLNAVVDRRVEQLKTLRTEQVLPMFPMLHTWSLEAFAHLKSANQICSDGLTTEITEMMQRKKTDRHSFLEMARKEMRSYLMSVRAQILLERNAGLKDQMVAVINQYYWLYGNSQKTFHSARGTINEDVQAAWKEFTKEWRERLAEAAKGMKGVKAAQIQKGHPEGAALLAQAAGLLEGAPGALTKLWSMYDRVIVDGASFESRRKEITAQEDECFMHIVPVLEALGFNREVYDQEVKAQDKVEDIAAKYETAGLANFLEARLRDAGSASEPELLKTIQILVRFGDSSRNLCLQYVRAPIQYGPAGVAVAAVVLANLKEKIALQALRATLSSHPEPDQIPQIPEAVRREAAEAIGLLGGSGLERDALASDLGPYVTQDRDAGVRMRAALGLQLLRSVRGIPFLIDGLRDAEEMVRKTCHSALVALAGENLNFDPRGSEEARKSQVQAIRAWWESNKERLQAAPADAPAGTPGKPPAPPPAKPPAAPEKKK